MRNRESCCIDLHVPRFIASLALPSTDARAPHPAFVQAVLLTGCYFSRSPSLGDYEIRFLAQTRREMAVSISGVDRLHDYVRASNLVAFYYFCKGALANDQSWHLLSPFTDKGLPGMYLEAYQQITASGRMAVSCGLHQINSSIWRPPSRPEAPDQFIAHPRDGVDLGERIHTLWQVSVPTSQATHSFPITDVPETRRLSASTRSFRSSSDSLRNWPSGPVSMLRCRSLLHGLAWSTNTKW